MSGLISPSLMGSCGVVPLTIIGPLSDICRHMSNCIARAEKEVFLVTSYWVHSNNARLITNGMRELSRRAGKRGERVVMKIMYDRGSVRQVCNRKEKRYSVPLVVIVSNRSIDPQQSTSRGHEGGH